MPPTLKETAERLRSRLGSVPLAQAVIFSDMTSTLIYQSSDGFPEETRRGVSRLLDSGGDLVLVTGDTYGIIAEEFFKRLRYQGERSIYVISAAGYLIYQWKQGATRELYRGLPMDLATREYTFGVIERLIPRFFHSGFKFSSKQLLSFLDGDGCRIDIGGALQEHGMRMLIEGSPNKVTVYSPDFPQAEGAFSAFLEELVSDQELLKRADTEGLHVVRGGNFFDLISTRKEEGIATLLGLPEGRALETENRQVIALGDSGNDKGVLNYEYPSAKPAIRVFVGSDEKFVQEELRETESADFFFLKGSYIQGGLFVLSNLG